MGGGYSYGPCNAAHLLVVGDGVLVLVLAVLEDLDLVAGGQPASGRVGHSRDGRQRLRGSPHLGIALLPGNLEGFLVGLEVEPQVAELCLLQGTGDP